MYELGCIVVDSIYSMDDYANYIDALLRNIEELYSFQLFHL